jgi:coenzyme F420-0:L-glutamate ligase/coenzyme F420-1:gamma-L-glutamate ligase
MTGSDLAVIVSDSFGRTWREGITNVAIGVSGMSPLTDYRGQRDPHGYPLEASVLAVADELAASSELVMGKTAGIPAAIVRGYPYEPAAGTGRALLMPPERDLFR